MSFYKQYEKFMKGSVLHIRCQIFSISNLFIISQITIVIFFNLLFFDVATKPFFKVQNIAPINVK